VERPISPYAATKRSGELLCHAAHHIHQTSVLCLRFFTVYGPRQRPDLAIHAFARRLAEGRPLPLFGDGSSARDYTYITDILDGVTASLRLLEAGPSRFDIVNLGESRTVTLAEMVRIVGEEMGIEPVVEHLPPQPGDVQRTWADVSRARALLGYEPSVDFRDGVREFVSWFRAAHGAGRLG
jgi:UDP-glucuronate 4-epimerase